MLYDQPHSDRRKARVTGPFTVEAVPAPVVTSVDEIVDPHPGPLPGGEGAMASPHPLEEGDTESPRLLGEGDRMEEGDVKNPLPLGEGRGEENRPRQPSTRISWLSPASCAKNRPTPSNCSGTCCETDNSVG